MNIRRTKNPGKDSRTLEEALAHAEKREQEMPMIAQVWPSDWDIVILADEIRRLRKLTGESHADAQRD